MHILLSALSLVIMALAAAEGFAPAADQQSVAVRPVDGADQGHHAANGKKLDDATALFRALQGQWRCSGAFANGKPLNADLSFRATLGGRALRYTHGDRAPSSYRQESTWSFDAESGDILSVGFITEDANAVTTAVLYDAAQWDARSVTFYHRKLTAEPFAPNRFTYELEHGQLKMLWEVRRGATAWQVGDHLLCERVTR